MRNLRHELQQDIITDRMDDGNAARRRGTWDDFFTDDDLMEIFAQLRPGVDIEGIVQAEEGGEMWEWKKWLFDSAEALADDTFTYHVSQGKLGGDVSRSVFERHARVGEFIPSPMISIERVPIRANFKDTHSPVTLFFFPATPPSSSSLPRFLFPAPSPITAPSPLSSSPNPDGSIIFTIENTDQRPEPPEAGTVCLWHKPKPEIDFGIGLFEVGEEEEDDYIIIGAGTGAGELGEEEERRVGAGKQILGSTRNKWAKLRKDRPTLEAELEGKEEQPKTRINDFEREEIKGQLEEQREQLKRAQAETETERDKLKIEVVIFGELYHKERKVYRIADQLTTELGAREG
ncbi:hypothetical protein V501_01405 [Pseudogymnoascus sp. VKM F-4519 (FW-2642)]|nr:hypothetical protein V501_01405 [Pseudogymnoascus sp. VKM F-4519 (FW-2642)]